MGGRGGPHGEWCLNITGRSFATECRTSGVPGPTSTKGRPGVTFRPFNRPDPHPDRGRVGRRSREVWTHVSSSPGWWNLESSGTSWTASGGTSRGESRRAVAPTRRGRVPGVHMSWLRPSGLS